MATDLERLVVRLEAQVRSFEKELARGRQSANSQLGQIENRFRQANKRISTSFDGVGSTLRRTFGALGITLGAREIQQFADQFTQIQNSLKVAGLQGEELNRVYQRLFESAQKNAAPIQALATLYGRAALVQKELKISTEELLVFTDRVALALRVSGQSAEQSSGALLQLSQALGSGVVRAEEFNSILEGALPIAQSAARGILEAGGSVAKLRQLVIDGKVSSEAFFRGFIIGSNELQRQAQGMNLTIGQAFTQVQNSLIDFIGKVDKISGASSGVVFGLNLIADAIRGIGTAVGVAEGPLERLKKKLEETPDLKKYLLAPLQPLILALEQLAAAGKKVESAGDPIETFLSEQRLKDINAELTRLREKLDDAQNQNLSGRAVDLDRQRIDLIRQRITLLEKEREALNNLLAPVSNQSPKSNAPGGGAQKPISLADYPVTGKKEKLDTFERSLLNAQKRIDILNTETKLVNENSAALERARLVIELETAARAKNQAEGKKNIEVTKEQRTQIEAMADQMYRAADAAEKARGPLNEFAREASRTSDRLQDFALTSVKSLEDALVSLGDSSTTTAEKFRNMASSILTDLSRLLIRQTITAPLAGWLGGLFTGGASADPWAGAVAGRAVGGPITAGTPYMVGERGPELIVPSQNGMVIPNHALRSVNSGGVTVSIPVSISADGADPAQLGRLTNEVARLQREMPARVVQAVRQANSSNVKLN